jgi:hypothetical protein
MVEKHTLLTTSKDVFTRNNRTPLLFDGVLNTIFAASLATQSGVGASLCSQNCWSLPAQSGLPHSIILHTYALRKGGAPQNMLAMERHCE